MFFSFDTKNPSQLGWTSGCSPVVLSTRDPLLCSCIAGKQHYLTEQQWFYRAFALALCAPSSWRKKLITMSLPKGISLNDSKSTKIQLIRHTFILLLLFLKCYKMDLASVASEWIIKLQIMEESWGIDVSSMYSYQYLFHLFQASRSLVANVI